MCCELLITEAQSIRSLVRFSNGGHEKPGSYFLGGPETYLPEIVRAQLRDTRVSEEIQSYRRRNVPGEMTTPSDHQRAEPSGHDAYN
jgi:hypothetical protein